METPTQNPLPPLFDDRGRIWTPAGWRDGMAFLLLSGLEMAYLERDLSRSITDRIVRAYEGGPL